MATACNQGVRVGFPLEGRLAALSPMQYDRFGFGRQGDPDRLGDDPTPGALPERPLWTDTLANC